MSALFCSLFEKYQNWKTIDYMNLVYENSRACTLEPLLEQAFILALTKQNYSEQEINTIITTISQTGSLQTSHHTALTHGPTFSTIDALSLCALPINTPYIIGANAGVAFSNPAWSGALCFQSTSFESLLLQNNAVYTKQRKAQQERENHGETEKRINFLTGKERDQLVYGTKINKEHIGVWQALLPDVQNLLIPPSEASLFSVWATKNAAKIQSLFFQRPVFIFDINLVVTQYLILALQDKNHFLYSLFFDATKQAALKQQLGFEPFSFLLNEEYKKKRRITIAHWDKFTLKTNEANLDKEEMLTRLQNNELCPGLFLIFFILCFYNKINTFGSFLQINYMNEYREKLKGLPDLDLDLNEKLFLTTGRLPQANEEALYPLDKLIQKENFDFTSFTNLYIKDIWNPIKQRIQKNKQK